MLDFLGLPSEHSEAELESAILDEMQRFLLELGVGFAFVERQKRMTVDGRDYRLDLLLYHITMRCYVALELKTRPLEPGDYGQMMLYLRWLNAHQRHDGDAALARYFDTTPQFWLGLQADYDLDVASDELGGRLGREVHGRTVAV